MKYTDDDLILYFYGEAERPDEIRDALAASPELRARYEVLERVLSAVDLPVPERPESYGSQVWARLRPGLDRRRPSFRNLLSGPRSSWGRAWVGTAAAAVLMLVLGFLAGRLWPRPEERTARALPEAARERILAGEVAGHLESSERLLMEVANADPGEPPELAAERAWARDLLQANRLYRQSARRGDRMRLAALLDELEPFLLELAHTPDDSSPEELSALRNRIEEQALLFKVRILGERLERSARQTRAGLDKRTL